MRVLFCFLFGLFILPSQAVGQPGGNLKKANTSFQAKNYGAAIPRYLSLLTTDSSNHQILSKLAYCYLMTNKQVRAAELYQRLEAIDKIRVADRINYGTCLFYLGLYDEAVKQSQLFLAESPDDPKALALVNACRLAPTIESMFPDAALEPVACNSPADDNSPVVMGEHLYFSSDRKAGFNPLKEKSGSTGRDYIRLYRIALDQLDAALPQPVSKLNTTNLNTSNLTFSSEDQEVIYCQNSVT
jgi:tetratricopeptide (TPR) repeat protein